MRKYFILFIIITFFLSCENSKKKIFTPDFVTADIENFYTMLSLLNGANSHSDTLKILKSEYLDKASKGLKDYLNHEKKFNNRDISKEYYKIISSFPKYFQSQKANFLNVRDHIKDYSKYFNELIEIYPEADFSATYFSIGFFNTQGQMIYPNTVFIGLEASVQTDSTNYSEFPENYSWLQDEVKGYKELGYIVFHENIHTLQKDNPNDNSILNQAIAEGAAVFLTEYFCGEESLIGGAGVTQEMINYEQLNKKQIWKDFTTDIKSSENFSKWFWSDESKYPRSMGYYLGYLICKNYFENQKDKNEALKTLIEIKHPQLIYKTTKYYKN